MDSVVIEGTPKDTGLVRVYVPVVFKTPSSYPFKFNVSSVLNYVAL